MKKLWRSVFFLFVSLVVVIMMKVYLEDVLAGWDGVTNPLDQTATDASVYETTVQGGDHRAPATAEATAAAPHPK